METCTIHLRAHNRKQAYDLYVHFRDTFTVETRDHWFDTQPFNPSHSNRTVVVSCRLNTVGLVADEWGRCLEATK